MRRLIPCIVLLLIAGCAPTVMFGQVSSKEFVPEHEESQMKYDVISETWKSEYVTIPDQWFIILIALVPDDGGRYNRTIHVVDRCVYDNVRLGEYYRIGDPASTRDCPMETGGSR